MKLKPIDIAQTSSAASIIFEALRKAITEGDLQDGEPLRQDEIAKLFNSSRIPVREAISRLEEHGLVKSQRYRGAVVAGLSVETAQEIFDFRSLLEAEVVRKAVPNMSSEILREARKYCEAFAKSPDPMEWGTLNRKFHATLYAASELDYHLAVVDKALDRVERYLRAQLVMTDGMPRAVIEHDGILQAAEKGDADLAAELTRQHIQGAKLSLVEHMKSQNAGKAAAE